jgi:mannitol/fructose-specific phosphotransferase system IIA component (Ntr-type)
VPTKPSSRLSRAHVFTDVPPGDRDDVLRDLVDRLVADGSLPPDAGTTVLRAVLKRERVGTTGLGRGIAIPHAKTAAVTEPIVAFARLARPIPYGASDGADVHSLFLVVSPAEAGEEHVAILRWVASIARSDYFARVLKNTSDPDSLHSLFLETDASA